MTEVTPASLESRFQPLESRLEPGRLLSVGGLSGSAPSLAALGLAACHEGPTVFVTPTEEEALAALGDARALRSLFSAEAPHLPEARLLPGYEGPPDSLASGQRWELHARRLAVLHALSGENPRVLVAASLASLLQPCADLDEARQTAWSFRVGRRYRIEELRRALSERGYALLPRIEAPGDAAFRGHIVDLFAPDHTRPLRLEFFDDELESIRRFDPLTQRSEETLIEAHACFPDRREDAATVSARAFASMLPERALFVFAHWPTALARLDHDQRVWPGYPYGRRRHDLERRASRARRVHLGALPVVEGPRAVNVNAERLSPPAPGPGALLEAVVDWQRRGMTVAVFFDEAAHTRQEVMESLAGQQVRPSDKLVIAPGFIDRGFAAPEWGLCLANLHELFGKLRLARAGRRLRDPTRVIDDFVELTPGDLVVHRKHGIGRFLGLQVLVQSGLRQEFLALEYRDGVKIYVPVAQAGLVQKYLGGAGDGVTLDRIGAAAWGKRADKVREAVLRLAAEMIRIQALRAARPGYAFPRDDEDQRRFRAAFPFEDTPDQRGCTEAIIQDMEAAKPMDRLLCGDVGFGKTELAVRAAYKAAAAGRQVMVVVPTTILAQQHGETFRARMEAAAGRVAVLTRFESPEHRRQVLAQAREGALDVLIGTHRLLSPDVYLPKLGLVIIDEEQKFGVAQKEKLKRMRATVDLLTLTATPIPRTLHQSMLGIRDISTLTTPPPDRLSVRTVVARYSEPLIAEALERELDRGGQAFFLHNRIRELPGLARKLESLAPEARVTFVHGRMEEHELVARMRGFIHHDYDVLLATTLIASGIDIPNANTLFVNRADRFGLAELHQLRGRVGRYNRRAYAYFLIPSHEPVREVAHRRLAAIEEFHELGAGFHLAMRDLEIRGAGNLLGPEQSGHIAAVGYELYCRLLKEAVAEMRQEPLAEPPAVVIDLGLEAGIPESLAPDQRARVDAYRRLGSLSSFTALDRFEAELIDRFGRLPLQTRHLLAQSRVALALSQGSVTHCVRTLRSLNLTFTDARRAMDALRPLGERARFHGSDRCFLPLGAQEHAPETLLGLLDPLWRHAARAEAEKSSFGNTAPAHGV